MVLPCLPPPRVVTWHLPSILMQMEAVESVMICFEGAFLVKWNQQALSVLDVTKTKGFNSLVQSAVTPQWVRTLKATTPVRPIFAPLAAVSVSTMQPIMNVLSVIVRMASICQQQSAVTVAAACILTQPRVRDVLRLSKAV
jgi:hypothetical protein